MTAGSNGFVRAIAVLSAMSAGLIALVQPALSDARLCRQLEAEFAGTKSTAISEKYDTAIAKQREQITKVRNRANAAGCGFSLFGRAVEDCAKLNANLAKMERNLDALEIKRAGRAGGRLARSQTQILAALDANNCRETRQMPQAVEAADGNVRKIERILGRAIEQRDAIDLEGERTVRRVLNPGEGVAGLAGTYRTFCVRTCDGYYFPMSPSSSRRQFARDQKNCEAACPSTAMQVFYQGEESDAAADMVSARTGAPYAKLPAAYRYKDASTPVPESCGCNAPKNFEVIAGNPPQETAEADTDAVTTEADPTFSSSIVRPEPPADAQPAASADDAGQPDVKTVSVDEFPPVHEQDPNRNVRVVGPTFLPAPEEAINLRAPARRHGQ